MVRLQNSVCACNYPEFQQLQKNAMYASWHALGNTGLLRDFIQLAGTVFTLVSYWSSK